MRDGFIERYAVSPLVEEPFTTNISDSDQMRAEKRMRECVATRNPSFPSSGVSSWKYYYSHGNVFVDFSTFYSELTKVSFSASTVLRSTRKCEKHFTLFTYGAVTLWLNGRKVASNDVPVYKPIISLPFTALLEEGENVFTIVFQNLGVRDTRNLFAIRVEEADDVTDEVPFSELRKAESEAVAFLDGCRLEKDRIVFPFPLANVSVGYDCGSHDYAKAGSLITWHEAENVESFVLDEDECRFVVAVEAGSSLLKRRFERILEKKNQPCTLDTEANYRRQLAVIANIEGLSRGGKFGFYIQTILARKALGIVNARDEEYFYTTLDQIERRFDCSDFLVSGVVRYMHNYPLNEKLKKRIDEVLINYRYWMSEEGSDAMCFWSENHSLLFYSSAMIVGAMYPDSYFPTAGMKGSELSAFGRKLTSEWMTDLENHGFEEFLSTVYMNITFVSLLNIVDYGDAEMSERAIKITDKLLEGLALHTFKGTIIAPMGRVYRGVIHPTEQGCQALVNLIDPGCHSSFGEGWLSYYATSRYRVPEKFAALMKKQVDTEYSSGSALIKLKKTEDYCLTSVASPRTDGYVRWKNITLSPISEKEKISHLYTKSFNERFHGTTFFRPGVYGYQQHLFSASLGEDAIVFVNHPGATSDSSSMRPGYWYGNGILPLVRQDGSLLAACYEIPDSYPVPFTHAYFPFALFDETESSGLWYFARKGKGYLALWCSGKTAFYDDMLSSSELRCYDKKVAYVIKVGSERESGSFEDFKAVVLALTPEYNGNDGKLKINGCDFCDYKVFDDETQYV